MTARVVADIAAKCEYINFDSDSVCLHVAHNWRCIQHGNSTHAHHVFAFLGLSFLVDSGQTVYLKIFAIQFALAGYTMQGLRGFGKCLHGISETYAM